MALSLRALSDGLPEDGEPGVLVVTQQGRGDAGGDRGGARARRRRAGEVLRARPRPGAPAVRPCRQRYQRQREGAGSRRCRRFGETTGTEVEGRVANSPNAYDDIVEELGRGNYREIILETLPSHVSHWLHVDLPDRVAGLGYPVQTVTATR